MWSGELSESAVLSFKESVGSSLKFTETKFCLKEMHESKKLFSFKEHRQAASGKQRGGATGGELDEPIDPNWPGTGGVRGGGGVSQVWATSFST